MYEKLIYTATEGQETFDVTFEYLDWRDIVVKVNGETIESGVDYVVTGGDVVLDTPATEGDTIIISRVTDIDTEEKPYLIKGRLTKEKLEKAFKYITYPIEEASDYMIGASDAASDTLDNLEDYADARSNLGVQDKATVDSSIDELLAKEDNLSDLTNVATARTNINTYSKSEATTKAQDAKDILDNFEIDGICITAGEYSPTIFDCTIDIYADGIFRINQNGGSKIWINNGLYLFNYIQGTLTDMQWDTLYYVYVSVDEDGGFYAHTTTTPPTSYPNGSYRGSDCSLVSNPDSGNPFPYDFFPFIGYVFGYGSVFYGRQTYHHPITWNKNEQLWYQAWQEHLIV